MFVSKQVLFYLFISSFQPCLLAKAVPREPETGINPGSRITVEVPKNIDRIISEIPNQIQEAPSRVALSPRNVDFNSVLKAAKDQPYPTGAPGYCLDNNPGRDATVEEFIRDSACRMVLDSQCVARAKTVEIEKRSLDLKKRVDRKNSDCLFQSGQSVVVDMGQTVFMPWRLNAPNAIGTIGLCGCTAVAIMGESGAIVSHMSPNLLTIDAQLDKLKESFNLNIRADIHVFAMVFSPTDANGDLVIPDLQDYVYTFIKSKLDIDRVGSRAYYANPSGLDGRDGTLVVKLEGNNNLNGYLNDESIF